jgi:hypothetical protein
MANRDILKEAIADAKSIKEAAIANAKVALEEAFTPYLKEKLSAKLAEIDAMDEEMDENKEMDEKMDMDEMKDMDESKDEMYEDENMDEMEDMDEMKKSMDEMDLDELLRELEDMEENMDETINDPKGPGAHGNIAPPGQSDTDLNEAKEGEEEESEEEDVEIDIENMSEEDLKSFIESVIADMVKAGELEAGHEGMENEEGAEEEESEEEEVSIDELLDEMGDYKGSGYDKEAKNQPMKNDHYEKMKEEMSKIKKELEEAYEALGKLNLKLTKLIF